MAALLRRFPLVVAAVLAAVAFLAVAVAVAYALLRPRLDAYAESDRFREAMGEQTGRGLKVEGSYAPITHEPGGWTAATPSWTSTGRPGEAIAKLDAETITARFNPWGVLRRLWQIDLITIERATLKLRRPDPDEKVPLPERPRPWYVFLMPQRMYLKLVDAQQADILWDIKKREVGIRKIHLWVTPYGKKDWRFQGTEGSFELLPHLPPARVVTMSVVVTKPLLTVESAELAPPDVDDPGRLLLSGTAGLQPEDMSIDASGRIERLPLAPWLSPSWKERLSGRLTGSVAWKGPDMKPEGAKGRGTLEIDGGRLRQLAALDQLAILSKDDSFRSLDFETASLSWEWNTGVLDVRDLRIEAPGKVRAEGTIHSDQEALSGIIRLGVKPSAVAWLPAAGRAFFSAREGSPYLWATMNLSGTLQQPKEDLSPKIRAAVFSSPAAILEIVGKEIGSWFD